MNPWDIMTLSNPSRRLWMGLLVAIVALISSAPTLKNHLAQDDVALILEDDRIADPSKWGRFLNETYWPPDVQRDLYRPLTSLLMAAEWRAGGGVSFSFKALQVAIYMASAIAVLVLALQLIPAIPAFAAAMLFAAHPVHVEAVALAVNQAEVVVALIAALSLVYYIDRRRAGPLRPGQQLVLVACTLVASHFKESGVMIPALLFAAELFAVGNPAGGLRRHALRSLVVWQTFSVTLVLALRSRIEFETVSGSFVAEAFHNVPIWERFLTMLAVVPEWFRLLLWPASLAADYSPNRIVTSTNWGLDQIVGLAILCLVGTLAWRVRKKLPVFTFGVAWVAVAIFPVSNVLVPTGIPLAERTLFLPSVGAMLSVGAFLGHLPTVRPLRAGQVARCLAALTTVVILLGMSRSRSRHHVWRNQYTMWSQAVIDSPDAYRPRLALGTLLSNIGHRDRAILQYLAALEIWESSWGGHFQLGLWYRDAGDCTSAIPHFRRAMTIKLSEESRVAVIPCLVWLGQYEEAKNLALEGIRADKYGPTMRGWYRSIVDAQRAGAPAGSVWFPERLHSKN